MGWNEARITFVPDGWDLVVEEINMRNVTGEPGRMVSTEKSLDCSGIVISASAIGRWLVARGFFESEKRKSGTNYRREDVLVSVYNDDDEVDHFVLEFTLTRDSPTRWAAWKDFAAEVFDAWPVTLADWDAKMKVGLDSFFPILRKTVSWQEFEVGFKWPLPEDIS